ncbi:M20/M25/M40 family metallo-hydrolase [Lentibacillus sp. Marseille-P4043]|uniref:M20/M25/M40 family metallo-hydrolase n=1 Tax=Lentibacillus sp. Marseille-P4043 TaxID=2040293 RepID=UPI000D0B858D|nr:M20/M25/M40 family metallo-hydrolase [Lentibacillus sp. Marseille-P4043]
MKHWQTKEALTELLCSLVHHQSVTESNAEIALAEYLYHILAQKEYFQSHPDFLKLHPLDDGRRLLTAFVKKGNTKETVILLSHFDVVGVEDYGSLENLAFHPKELTKEMERIKDELPEQVRQDIITGDWLFGRGSMDMKAGLSLHLSMIEKAIDDEFDGNILLLTVPDEEVNSHGMLTALPVLNQLKKEENITYNACLNGEPMFSKYPGDDHYYVYTGSIGKVLPGFYCYGKESHVGEPFAGVNPNLMISFLSQQLELNEAFIEKIGDEVTPPPTSLMQRDLKEAYSVQTPNAAIAMYNVLYLKQSFHELNEKLIAGATQAAQEIENHVKQKAGYFADVATDFTLPDFRVRVMMYEELYHEAVKRYGKEEITRRQNLLVSKREHGDRDFSTLLVQDLAALCKDLGPMIILFYSPPFYPAVSSFDDPYIQDVMDNVTKQTKEEYQIELTVAEFFTGLSDLSYVGPPSSQSKLSQLTTNMPLQNNGFVFPEDVMEQLTMPVLNIGPLGRDPHQWTERLELTYSFEYLPEILTDAIKQLLKKK